MNIILVYQSHCEVIYAPFLANSLPKEVSVAVFLNLVVVKATLDLVADAFDVTPGSLDIQSVIKVKLFVDHTHTMISPHMKKSKLAKLTRSIIKVTITHVAIRKNSVTSSNMLFKDGDNMSHSFVPD